MKTIREIKDSLSWETSQDSRAELCLNFLGAELKPKDIHEEDLENLTSHLKKRNIKGSTINRYLASVSTVSYTHLTLPTIYSV